MIISKASYGYGEPKNVIALSVQKNVLRMRAFKLSGFMQSRIEPTMKIWGNSGLLISIVPNLHQSSDYIKRKLLVWRAYKYNHFVDAKIVLAVAGMQTTRIHSVPNKTNNGNLRKLGFTYLHGTEFAPKQ